MYPPLYHRWSSLLPAQGPHFHQQHLFPFGSKDSISVSYSATCWRWILSVFVYLKMVLFHPQIWMVFLLNTNFWVDSLFLSFNSFFKDLISPTFLNKPSKSRRTSFNFLERPTERDQWIQELVILLFSLFLGRLCFTAGRLHVSKEIPILMPCYLVLDHKRRRDTCPCVLQNYKTYS